MISMMRAGESKVPLNRIPDWARTCEVSPATFIRIAMKDYYPEVRTILEGVFNDSLKPTEEDMMLLFRVANP